MTPVGRPAAAVMEALAALQVEPPTRHSWVGELVELPEPVLRLSDEAGLRDALIGSIAATLYDGFYTHGAPRPARPDRLPVERTLTHELAAANEGAGCLEPGWRLVGEDDGRLIVQRGGLRLWAGPEEVVAGGTGMGDAVALRLPPDLPAYSPGFYVVRGQRGFSADGPRVLDRFYLDLSAEGAVPFVREASRRLNDAGLAFTAKVVDHPAGFDRRDAAVMAFERPDRDRAFAAAEEVRGAVTEFLDGGAPAMTLPLAPGLAFAEDPGGGVGFGWNRCVLIAKAVVTAAERGIDAPEDRIEVVRERFAQAGIDLDTPHLGPPSPGIDGASDLFEAAVR